ncbi:MAG: 50S ribosomal protein L10 [Omnitrophica bacterium GWA2_50_21]|nr:MAG: 50S ribosomal protein L10 [Omnitrophica bacterium GWA2_50_21]
MPGADKVLILEKVNEKVEGVPYIFFGKFKGLAVNDFAQMRRSLEKISKNCFVPKKTILKKVLAKKGVQKLDAVLDGSIVMVTAEKDPQVVSKFLVNFAKEKESFQLAGACVEGEVQGVSYVKELAKLPSRIELIAKVVGGIKAPITGFVLTVRGVLSSFVNVLDQVSKQKHESSESN